METRESKRIYITHGAEYRAVEEYIYEKNLLFGDVYAQARDCLEEIIKISEQMQEKEQSTVSDFCAPYEEPGPSGKRKPENVVRRRSSNLIAFCAERGGGKTSAMISFVRALENLKRPANKREQKENFWKGKKAFNYHYELVPSIDPTSMEIDDSILKMVLVHMYANFQEHVKTERETGFYGNKKEGEREELIKQFLRCFHFANRLNYKTKQPVPLDLEDELEFMEDKECGDTFRIQLYTLFEAYLQYMSPEKDSMLVISIDDADVNTARVYDLLEDVRKYLQMPKVVVVMAANMTQLESTVEQHFLRQYAISLTHADSMVSVERCHSIAELYLKKIIPSTRQLNLPSLSEELQASEGNVEVVYQDKNEPGKNLIAIPQTVEDPEEGRTYEGIYQQELLGLLHRKTGLVFIPPKGYLHDFLPTGMRELTHFLAFLWDMPDVEATYDTIVDQVIHPEKGQREALLTWQRNLKQIQHYLVNIWSATNLRTASKMLLKELINQPQEDKHEYLLRILPDYYSAERGAYNILLGIATEEEKAYSDNFVSKNVEVGVYKDYSWRSGMDTKTDATYEDVMAALRILTNSQGGNRQYKLAYAVRLYYTIYLHTLLLKDCCDKPPYDPNALGEKPYGYCITDFLRDGLFKCSPQGSATDNSAFWHLPVNGRKLMEALSAAEKSRLEESTPQNKIKSQFVESPEKKAKADYQSSQSFMSRWFRVWEQTERYGKGVWVDRVISDKGTITDSDIVIFHPFYPLFAEMDALTSRRIVSFGAQMEYEPGTDGRKRLFLSMMILLNTDVQQYLLHEFKRANVLESQHIDPKTTLTGVLDSNEMKTLLITANRINGGQNQKPDEYVLGIWQKEKDLQRYLAVLGILPGLKKTYFKYLIQQIDEVHKDLSNLPLSEMTRNEVTINELENVRQASEDSEERKKFYQKVPERDAQLIISKSAGLKDKLKNLLEGLLNINEDLFTKGDDKNKLKKLNNDDPDDLKEFKNDDAVKKSELGYDCLTHPISEILGLLETYRSLLKKQDKTKNGCTEPDEKATTENGKKEAVKPIDNPVATEDKQSPYDLCRECFRALFDEMESRNIRIAQISPESDTSDEQK